MDELLGDGHRAILGRLLRQLDALQAGDDRAPRTVLLTGPSGAGKSRIIRELYRELVARQPSPGYWPPLPEAVERSGGSAVDAALGSRKVIGPPVAEFVWPAGALPSFTWWDFNCGEIRPGSPIDAVAHAAPAIDVHQLPALLAWRRSASVSRRLGTLKDDAVTRVREAIAAGGSELAGLALDSVGLAIPGWGLLFDWLKGAGKAFTRHREENAALAQTRTVGAEAIADRGDAVVKAAEVILSAVAPDLPAVVVVEDIHLMGAELRRFLESLQVRRPDQPVLVVATAWPEGDHHAEYQGWRNQAELVGNLAVDAVPELPADALATFVLSAAPATEAENVGLITGHFANPLALQLFLGLSSTRRRIARHAGALVVDEAGLGALDNSIRGLYQQRFDELPTPVKQALSHAAATLPDHTLGTWPYISHLVTLAATRAAFIDADGGTAHRQALAQAADPYGWARSEAPGVDRFREPVLDDIARGHDLDPADLADLRQATVEVLREVVDLAAGGEFWLTDDEVTDELRRAAQWLIGLLPDEPVDTVVDAVAVIVAARVLADTWQYAPAVNLLVEREALDLLPPDHRDTLVARGALAGWVGSAGRLDLAVGLSEQVLSQWLELFGPDDPDTITARHNLAAWLGEQGRIAEARVQLEAVLADLLATREADDPTILAARSELALLRRDAGELAAAEDDFRDLLADRLRVSGTGHLDTFGARQGLARVVGLRGRASEAVEILSQLLADLDRSLGATHPVTLGARGERAYWLERSGLTAAAWAAYTELGADAEQVLGRYHPQTLVIRSEVGRALGVLSRDAEATEMLGEVLRDIHVVSGPDHPLARTVRNNLALALGEVGRTTESLDAHTALVKDNLRLVGPDHPDTLISRYNLGLAHKRAGDLATGAAIMEELLPDQLRVLGPDHPETLKVLNSLAHSTGELGRPDEAAERLAAVIADRTRILGSDHPDTVSATAGRAAWLHQAGSLDLAEQLYRQALDDTVRILGSDDPAVFTIRTALATIASDRGEPATALAEFAVVLDERTRVLGPEHPVTLQSRSNWIVAVAKAGRVTEAIALTTDLITDQLRVLDADHLQVLGTRENLMHHLADAGDLAGAVLAGEELLGYLGRQRVVAIPAPSLQIHFLLASWLAELARHGESAGHYRAALDLTTAAGGDPDEEAAALHYLLAFELAEADDPGAIDAYLQALEVYAGVVGAGHPDALRVRTSYASLLELRGDLTGAVREYALVRDGRRAAHGADAPETLDAEQDLLASLAARDAAVSAMDGR